MRRGALSKGLARLFHFTSLTEMPGTLGALLKACRAAIDEHDRANDQGGGEEHV